MNCLECQERLQQRLDGDSLPTSPALDQHLSQCAECRENYLAAQQLQEGLRQLPRPMVRPNFARSLAAEVTRERRHRQAKVRQRVLVTVAMAASVLVVLTLAYLWMPPAPTKDHVAKDQPKQVAPPQQVPDTKQRKEKDPPLPFVDLPERMADATRDHAKVFLVAANLDGVEKLPAVQDLPMLDPGMREAGQEVSEGVRMVTHNARKAFDFFARELPMADPLAKTD